ncbi:short-chain dehydrogenase TIC 32, chloroplastic-like isoform X2 [Phalaenopsis equestris]|nr:short-chain dehydrogenase TIC 32, chloroplastic-like isoform X2 [Phalaenopsis equestris]
MGIDRAAIEMVLSFQFWRMAILWPLALLYCYARLNLAALFRRRTSPREHFRCRLVPDSAGGNFRRPICIITGATSGLGLATARALVGEGYHVVLAGRCAESLYRTIQEIKQEYEEAHLTTFQVDLSSLQSVVKFEASFKQWLLDSDLHPSVQLLINNAGILATSSRITADGYDQMIQTNFISAVVLTSLLLPLIKNSSLPSRIVNVTSFTHLCASNMKIDCKKFSRNTISEKYPFASIYEYSKLCLLLFSYELHRRLRAENLSSKISIIPVDPGVVHTNILREVPSCLSQLAFRVLSFLHLLQSPEAGASSIIDAALAPSNVSGEYFFGGRGRRMGSSSLSYDAKAASQLWLNTSIFEEQV